MKPGFKVTSKTKITTQKLETILTPTELEVFNVVRDDGYRISTADIAENLNNRHWSTVKKVLTRLTRAKLVTKEQERKGAPAFYTTNVNIVSNVTTNSIF